MHSLPSPAVLGQTSKPSLFLPLEEAGLLTRLALCASRSFHGLSLHCICDPSRSESLCPPEVWPSLGFRFLHAHVAGTPAYCGHGNTRGGCDRSADWGADLRRSREGFLEEGVSEQSPAGGETLDVEL